MMKFTFWRLALLVASICLPPVGRSKKFGYPVDVEQRGKVEAVDHKGLQAFERLSIPVPQSLYDKRQVDLDTAEFDNFWTLIWDLQWWQWLLSNAPDYKQGGETAIYDGYYLGEGDDYYFDVDLGIEADLNWWAQRVAFVDNETFADYGTQFMERANETSNLLDYFAEQIANLTNFADAAYYRVLGDYMGVGINVACKAHIDHALTAASQWDIAGASAATTLMAFIPVLLTFGSLVVPRSSEVFCTSFLVGIMSAVFSLCLPVASISGVPGKQRVEIGRTFGTLALKSLTYFSKQGSRQRSGMQRDAKNRVKLVDLQKWSTKPSKAFPPELTQEQLAVDNSFHRIKKKTMRWNERAHHWHVPGLLFAGLQVTIYLTLVAPLFLGLGTPLLLLDCRNYWTSLWIIITGVLSAISRLLMWETGSHERVKVFSLSEASIKSLRAFVLRTTRLDDDKRYMLQTTETELPPLYPPIFTRSGLYLYQLYAVARSGFQSSRSGKGTHAQGSPSNRFTLQDRRDWRKARPRSPRVKWWIKVLWMQTLAAVKTPMEFLSHGVATGLQVKPSARRWRPLIVLMHLSTAGRHPLMSLFNGLVEGVVLVLLTVFFGAQWGGNLVVLCYVIAILLVAVTAGRALGLWFVWRSSKVYGLHVVECDDKRQIVGFLRILCSMTEVVVQVNGAWFFEGHRIDEREGFLDWRQEYVQGVFDVDEFQNDRNTEYHPVSKRDDASTGVQEDTLYYSRLDPPRIPVPDLGDTGDLSQGLHSRQPYVRHYTNESSIPLVDLHRPEERRHPSPDSFGSDRGQSLTESRHYDPSEVA